MAELTAGEQAAALWGSAMNEAYPTDQRLAFALQALDHYGSEVGEPAQRASGDRMLPEYAQHLTARERATWLLCEAVYGAATTSDAIEPRRVVPFADLAHDAQVAVMTVILDVVPMVHAVAGSPEARRG